MTNQQNLQLELAPEITDQLHLQKGQSIAAELYADRLVLQQQSKWEPQSMASWIYLVATALLSLVFFITNLVIHQDQIPLVGNYSITTFLIIFGGLLGIGAFTANFILNRRMFMSGLETHVFWRMLPVIVISFSLVLVVLLLGCSWLLNQLFTGASFDRYTSTLILAVCILAVSSFWGQIAEQIRATWLTTLFTVIIIAGVLLAMATNSSSEWWKVNLSFLGTSNATDSWQFNLTLILSAFILLSQVDYLFVALQEKLGKSWKLLTLRSLLTLLAIDLGAVGYFPNNTSTHVIHTRVAGYLVYLVIALIVGVRWLMPKVTREFLVTSYTIGGILIVLEIAYQGISYLSLTAFEMSAFLLAFTWLVMLFNRLEGLLIPEKKAITVHIL